MRKTITYWTLLLCITMQGCVTEGDTYKAFNNDLESVSGKSISNTYIWHIGYLQNATPDSVMKLENGNEIWVFNLKVTYKICCGTDSAIVYVEVDKKTQKVIQASCRGTLCKRPI
jgi:hypothetical protein